MKRLLAVLSLVVILVAAFVPTATAAPERAAVSGSWTWVGTLWESRVLPTGGEVGYGEEIGTWVGGFTGSSFDTFRGVFQPHPGDLGIWIGTLWIEFDGTVNGVSGKMLMRVTFWGHDPKPGMQGHWTIVKGWDGLEGLSGTGTWHIGDGDAAAEYTGVVRMR